MTKAIAELIDLGHIREMAMLRQVFIVSVAMDQLYTNIRIFNGSNTEVIPGETVELHLLGNKDSVENLIELINDKITMAGIDRCKIMGVGIGMPGFVNSKLGINYSYLKSPGVVSLRDYLEKALELPVHLDNDSSIIALAESKFGLAKDKKDVMVVNVGWGIGLGMIINGELYRGHNGYAGEFSHIPISDNDTLCDCGKRGCLETEATLRVVANKAIQKIKEGKITNMQLKESAEEMCEVVMDAANRGDQIAIELFSEVGYQIGKGISISYPYQQSRISNIEWKRGGGR